ncbi:hypothetical protein QCD70_15200 [Agreia sp. PsM10]|uniref:hypothetical protein n=1 Tax=Agreia sp. PsM10 TaxID=3030533 RepID=UPI00263B2CE8|nr:hypothetical protein [Agreia sp. PsM10]MDN4641598.1 hypothetical protein [Agreia sp. PsM10]
MQAFFDGGVVSIESLEPSNLEYHEVQRDAYSSTLETEKQSLRSTDQARRNRAYQQSRPTLAEGAKATVAAAAIEGGTTFVLAVIEKRRQGKNLKDFTSRDWIDIATETGFGSVTGGVRGLSIYSLTNFTATSGAVASAVVTAALAIAEQANCLRHGEIDELEFIENAETIALRAAISALSSFVGQALIPVPVIGAVIGNTIGTIMYTSVSSSLSKREAELISEYLEQQRDIDKSLAANYRELIDKLDTSMATYLVVLERASSPDLDVALRGSVDLALQVGVAATEILDSSEKVTSFFID